MNRNRRFDCVAMKDEIQHKLLSDWRGIGDAQVVQRIRKNLRASKSPIGSWWRRLEVKNPRSDAKPVVTR